MERDVAEWWIFPLMVRWVVGSIPHGETIELFLVPASAGVTKAVVCAILSVRWCIKQEPMPLFFFLFFFFFFSLKKKNNLHLLLFNKSTKRQMPHILSTILFGYHWV